MTLDNQQNNPGPNGADLELQRMFRSTLGAELDRQRGRAGAAFAQAVGSEERRSLASQTQRRREVRHLRMLAGASSMLAACLAIVVGLQAWMRPGSNQNAAGVQHAVALQNTVPVMDQEVFTREVDGGTIVLEDSPMRVVRQQTLKRTRWFDPGEQATYSVTEPIERVGYVPALPY